MKIAMLAFSLTGAETGRRLKEGLEKEGHTVSLDWKSKYLPDSISESHSDWTARMFREAEGIIFLCACGIAVRSIAPFIKSKKTDPAVLVLDESGQFVISLLSGHLGGANELTAQAARILHALPVVTTATDIHGKFAVDVFAKKNGCSIRNMRAAKEVSAALLAGENVGFYSEFPYDGTLPQGLVSCGPDGLIPCGAQGSKKTGISVGIAVTVHKNCRPFASTVQLIPRVLTVGVGCRKGKDADTIFGEIMACLERENAFPEALEQVSSIDLKKEEKGIIKAAERLHVPFVTWTKEELACLSGTFTPSDFVQGVTGVENVCERSAVKASSEQTGRLLQKKQAGGGVTTALAEKDWRITF